MFTTALIILAIVITIIEIIKLIRKKRKKVDFIVDLYNQTSEKGIDEVYKTDENGEKGFFLESKMNKKLKKK